MNEKDQDNVKLTEPETERKENEEESTVKRRTKEDRPRRKDDKKPTEQHMRILSHASSTEEKLDVMCKKYSQVVDENRRLSLALKHSEKKVELLLREREQLQVERSKGIMTRKRLENLCRELQKQNKIVKNESLQRVKEQEEIRKDLSEKFQGGLAQITTLMNQNIEKNAKMYEENLEINKKFKAVYEQVEQKEQQLLKVHQQMKLDLQVADTKLAKVKMEATAEKEALLKEKQQLLLKMSEYQAQIKEFQATEVGLRSEISMYTDKYDEFQNALNRSNKIYGEFNVEMEKMTKKIHVLEKETSLWKQRWANSHDSLLAMAADRQVRDDEVATLNKKLALFQDLCKMFQSERTKLLAQLKTQDNKTSASESLVVSVASQEVVEKQSNELPSLENTIKQLQVSLNNVTDEIQKDSSASPRTVTTGTENVTAMVSQKLETVVLCENDVEKSQIILEDVNEDRNEDCNSAKSERKTTNSTLHLDSTLLDVTEMEVENNNEELMNTSGVLSSTITEISREELDKSVGSPEKVNEDKLLSKDTSEETNVTASLHNTRVSNESVVIKEQVQVDIKHTNGEMEVEKRDSVSEQNSTSQSGLEPAIPSNELLQTIDLMERERVDSLRDNANDRVNEEIFTIKKEDSNSRTDGNTTNEVVEENGTAEVIYMNSDSNVDFTRHDTAVIIEKSTEDKAEVTTESTNYESTIESISELVKNTFKISETADIDATNKDTTLTIDEKSQVVAETSNEVVKNSPELVDNTIEIRLTKDAMGTDISESETELGTSTPITKNGTSSKEVSVEMLLTLEDDCIEEKLRKPIKNGKRRKK